MYAPSDPQELVYKKMLSLPDVQSLMAVESRSAQYQGKSSTEVLEDSVLLPQFHEDGHCTCSPSASAPCPCVQAATMIQVRVPVAVVSQRYSLSPSLPQLLRASCHLGASPWCHLAS